MGNRTRLSIGGRGEFEANNCLPVTWLALFDPRDFLVETHQEQQEEEFEVALYRTSAGAALERVARAIGRLRGRTPAWAFLRPLEILRDELAYCAPDETVELNTMELWATSEASRRKVAQAPAAFARMLEALRGDTQRDLAALNELAGEYSLVNEVSVANLSGEERMLVLLGTYWGDAEREALYSLEYFGESYWHADS